jgi:hypothetical protein
MVSTMSMVDVVGVRSGWCPGRVYYEGGASSIADCDGLLEGY